MYECSDLRKGLKFSIDGDPYKVVQFEFVKPGKGQGLYKCKIKNMISGAQFERTYRSGEKFQEANIEELDMEYLYSDGENCCFMNTANYEQEFISNEQVGDALDLLKDNTVCTVLFYNKRAIDLTLPNFVILEVTQADPWVKGDTATGSYKPATLETGYEMMVPPFVEVGQKIRIDTRTREYCERVKG